MNHIFKTVWNRVRRCYVAVNEKVQSASQSNGKAITLVGATALLFSEPALCTLEWQPDQSGVTVGSITTTDQHLHKGIGQGGSFHVTGFINASDSLMCFDGGKSTVDSFISLGVLDLYHEGTLTIQGKLKGNGTFTDRFDENFTPDPYVYHKDYSQRGLIAVRDNATLNARGGIESSIVSVNRGATINASNVVGRLFVDNSSKIESNTATLGDSFLLGKSNFTDKLITTGLIKQSGTSNISNLQANSKIENTGSLTVSGDLSFGKSGSLTNKGTLITHSGNVFSSTEKRDSVEIHTISLGSQVPESIRTTLSQLFTTYAPGTISDELANHVTFSSGKLIVTGVNLTVTQRDDLTKAFKERFLHDLGVI